MWPGGKREDWGFDFFLKSPSGRSNLLLQILSNFAPSTYAVCLFNLQNIERGRCFSVMIIKHSYEPPKIEHAENIRNFGNENVLKVEATPVIGLHDYIF